MSELMRLGMGESDSWGRAKLCVRKNAKLEQLKNCCYFIYHVNKFNKTEYLNCKPKYVNNYVKIRQSYLYKKN